MASGRSSPEELSARCLQYSIFPARVNRAAFGSESGRKMRKQYPALRTTPEASTRESERETIGWVSLDP